MRSFTLRALALGAALTIVCSSIAPVADGEDFETCCAKAHIDTWNGNLGGSSGDSVWQGGVDVLFFDVYANHGVGGTGSSFFEDFGTSVDARYWFGYRSADGLGLHARYFEYEGDPSAANEFVDVTLFDLDGSAVLRLRNWDLTGIAGFRYGEIVWSDENGAPGFSFEGVGMTLGGEVRRMLRPSLAIVGRCRYSALYGRIMEVENINNVADGTAVHGLETSIGVEWSRCTRAGLLTVGFGWEQQSYFSLSGNVDNDIDPEDVDITLAGPVFSFAFAR